MSEEARLDCVHEELKVFYDSLHEESEQCSDSQQEKARTLLQQAMGVFHAMRIVNSHRTEGLYRLLKHARFKRSPSPSHRDEAHLDREKRAYAKWKSWADELRELLERPTHGRD